MKPWMKFIKTNPTLTEIQNRIDHCERLEAGAKCISEQIEAQDEREVLEVIRDFGKHLVFQAEPEKGIGGLSGSAP